MARDSVHQLRYLGVIPLAGRVDYGFQIEDKEKGVRIVVLEIDAGYFRRNELMVQEGPDLCYQKVLADLGAESADSPLDERVVVTASDIARYREVHATAKERRHPKRTQETG